MASFAMASQLSLIPDPGISPRLDVIDVGDHRAIQVGGHAVACYRRDDVTSERVIATQLAETLALDACEIAAAFGMHPVTLSRLRGQFRAAGAQALISRQRGPKGPTKLTPRLLARFQELREEGLSFRAIARRVSHPGREISYGSVALALKGHEPEPTSRELPFEEAELEEPRSSSEATQAELVPGEKIGRAHV